MNSIQVNARYIRSLRHIMATDDVRHYLCGVLVEATEAGRNYVACNGHKMAIYHEPWGDGEDTDQRFAIIIPADAVKAVKPISKNLDCAVLTELEGGRWSIGDVLFTPVDGKFPDWRRVVPEKVSGEHADFDFSLLDDFNSCAKEGLNAKWSCAVYQNGNSSAPIRSSASSYFLGVLMPLRSACEPDYVAPEWLPSVPAKLMRKAA